MFSWFSRHPESTVALVAAAFPGALETDVRRVMRVVPSARLAPLGDIGPLVVGEETVHLPYRVYFDQPQARDASKLSPTQQMILSALYTRHHDGYIREASVLRLVSCQAKWVAPFVAQLLAEYVIEIAQALVDAGVSESSLLKEFALLNPDFCRLSSARIQSYWALYYRRRYVDFREYPVYIAASGLGLWSGPVPRRRRAAL